MNNGTRTNRSPFGNPQKFRPSTIKRHNPRTVRNNVGPDHHGCLVIDVRQGAWLYRCIEAVARRFVGEVAAI